MGAAAFGEALLENSALEFLALSNNGVGDEGAKGLAKGLRGNTGLRRLDLYFNMVGDEGTMAIAEALSVNRGLRTLHIDTNRVSEDGGLALARAIRGGLLGGSGAMLGELTLAYNQLSNVAIDAFISAAKRNQLIHKLTIDHNHMVHGVSKQDVCTACREPAALAAPSTVLVAGPYPRPYPGLYPGPYPRPYPGPYPGRSAAHAHAPDQLPLALVARRCRTCSHR